MERKQFGYLFAAMAILLFLQLCAVVGGIRFYPAIVMPMFAYVPVSDNLIEIGTLEVDLVHTDGGIRTVNQDVVMGSMPKNQRLWVLKLQLENTGEGQDEPFKQWLLATLPGAENIAQANFYWAVTHRSPHEPAKITNNERTLLKSVSFAR